MRSSTNTTPNRPTPRNARAASRPGSALIIVIGTLALISVFAAIYISVGQSDRRSAATVRQRADLSGIVNTYADHIASTIAADRLDAVLQPVDARRQYQAPRRVLTDAPWTDWFMRSESNEPWRLFNQIGGNPYPVPTSYVGDDPRVPSDPWLAATRPTYLGDPFNRVLSQNDPRRAYLDNRDWYQISNVAPDGRFVNLFNLRGNFRAEPGVGRGPGGPRLSDGLTLFKLLRDSDPRSPVQAYEPVESPFVNWMPGLNRPDPQFAFTTDFSQFTNTPAVFTMFQRFAFLPADPAFITYTRDGRPATWAHPDYPHYQWADADGDGMLDSRWFELTSARTPHAGAGPRDDVQRFYDDSEYRVFAAARIIDLSSMVNVNTAIENVTPPTAKYPLGLTPSEVDLRRLLTMQDAAENYESIYTPDQPLSFSSLWEAPRPLGTGNNLELRSEADYTAYTHISNNSSPLQLDPDSNAMRVGRYAAAGIRRGMEQHGALGPRFRGARSESVDPDEPYVLYEGSPLQRQAYDPGQAVNFNRYAGGRAESYTRFGRLDPSRLSLASIEQLGLTGDNDSVDSEYFDTTVPTPSGLYGLDDLAELLTYHGLNDPDVTSRLELNALARYDGPEGQERYSPLLSTRPLTLDRDRHGQFRGTANQVRPQGNINRPSIVDGRIAPQSLALFELSPRTVLTPLSGAVPMGSMGVAGPPARAQGPQSQNVQPAGVRALSSTDAAVSLKAIAGSAHAAFRTYYHTLAGELEMYRAKRNGAQDGPNAGILNDLWRADLTLTRDSPYATLFYGHRGPELALRIAAHAAVNTKDAYDNDNNTPTVATLVLHNEFGNSTQYASLLGTLEDEAGRKNFNPTLPQNALALFYPGLVNSDTRFDLDAKLMGASHDPDRLDEHQRVLPPQGQNPRPPIERQAVNVIGVEPMPVITEVASFYVYTDAGTGAGGDADFTPVSPGNPIPISGAARVTINGTVSDSNEDLLAAVLAFQIHNPWDVAISLGASGADDTGPQGVMWRVGREEDSRFDPQSNLVFNYYVEYNGHYFKLGEFWEYTPASDNPEGFDAAANAQIVSNGGSAPPPNARLDNTFSHYQEFQYRNVVLAPGETRVFYAMAHPRFEGHDPADPNGLENRWERVLSAYGYGLPVQFTDPDNDTDGDGMINGRDGRGWTHLAQEWIENQLAVRGGKRAARVHAFDPTTGRLVNPANGDPDSTPVFWDVIAGPGSLDSFSRDPEPNQVRLWRKFVLTNGLAKYEEATNKTLADYPGGTRRNLVENDILVDRVYLDNPGSTDPFLAVSLPPSNIQITDTVSFSEGYNDSPDDCSPRNDNSGLSLVRWATVRRRDAGVDEDTGKIGRIEPWLIQSRSDPSSTWIRSHNRAGHAGAYEDADIEDELEFDDFFTSCGGAPHLSNTTVRRHSGDRAYDIAYNPFQLINRGLNPTHKHVRTIALPPGTKSDANDLTGGKRFPREALGANLLGHTPYGGSSPLKPEVFLGRQLNAPRIADALMALGIGPTWAPNVADPDRFNFEDKEWMTLTEAFSVALGYEKFQPLEPEAANAVWHDAARLANGRPEYVLDNLHLRIDDYVPFLNVIQSANETGPNGRPEFTRPLNVGNPGDFRRGAGVPLALGLLDRIRAFDPLDLPGAGNSDDPELTRPLMGLVNVQTAPLKVLRLLPGLTPSAQEYRPFEISGALHPEWWGAAGGLAVGAGVADLQTSIPTANPDVAAGIVAYRDRVAATPRLRSVPTEVLSYQPLTSIQNAQWLGHNFTSEFLATNPSDSVDRASLSGIPGLRGTPMFASLGELLAVAIDETNPSLNAASRRHLTVQAYYGDGENLQAAGSGDSAVGIDPKMSTTDRGDPGATDDDFAERLAVAAGIMNTTTVRSDYFAAWFVLQGFRESDVSGLRPEDPLVPSFKRRFLMVIDRSNVVEPGDSPRVVLFKELPL